MFLKSNGNDSTLQMVYQLSTELAKDPEQIRLVQSLTIDPSRPFIGLKGTYGLFGSSEWWENIKNRILPTCHVSGVIKRLFVSGQEKDSENNAFELLLDDGSRYIESIYSNTVAGRSLFKVGNKVEIIYALDELKMQPAVSGGVNYSKIVLEMAVHVPKA
ncbi:hypothetical protein BZL41_20230 [Pseudomonas sp. PIC25]|nr:hypothetical protein BZL41_20230 [Pseudomonas sp. PIC25]